MNNKQILQAEVVMPVRFNEVDSMNIVWHGTYVVYFESAREAFGKKYRIDYLHLYDLGYYTPLVELNIRYKRPLMYGDTARVVITFIDTDSAKIRFDYEIYNAETGVLAVTGNTLQVFTDVQEQKLVWNMPEFFIDWKKRNGLL